MYELQLRITAETRQAIADLRRMRKEIGQAVGLQANAKNLQSLRGLAGVHRTLAGTAVAARSGLDSMTAGLRQQERQARATTRALRDVQRAHRGTSVGAARDAFRGNTFRTREAAMQEVIQVRAGGQIAREQARTAAVVARSQMQIQNAMRRTGREKGALGQNFKQFGGGLTGVLKGIQDSFRVTFLNRGFLNIHSALFAPLSRVRAGLQDLSSALVKSFGVFTTINPVRMLSRGFDAFGDVLRGVGNIAGGSISQLGRLVALPARLFGAIAGGIPGGFGKIAGFAGGLAGSIIGRYFTPFRWRGDFRSSAWSARRDGSASRLCPPSISFERNVSEALSQIPRVGQDAFGKMQDVALGLSRELGRGPTEIVDAIKLATSVGFSEVKDFTKVAREATRMSVAGFSDIKTSTEALTNTMNSFGLGADRAGEVADKLFQGFRVGGGSMEFFSKGLETIASTVHAAGGWADDLIGVTALLSRAAAGNSRIFIETQQAFQRIVSPTTKASQAMREMGIEVSRNQQGGVDFFGTLEQIQKRVSVLSGGDTLKAFQILRQIFPEERSARAFAKLMSANADSIREVRQAMGGARGSVSDALGQVNERSFRQIEKLSAAWQRLKIVAGGPIARALEPALRGMADVISQVEQRIDRLTKNQGFDRLQQSFRGLVSSLGISLPSGNTIADVVERLIRQSIPEVLDRIAKAAQRVRETLGGFSIPGVIDWLDNMRERGIETFIGFGKAAIEWARPVLTVVNVVGQGLLGMGEILTGLGKIGQSAFNLISAGVRGLGSLVVDLIARFYDATAALHRLGAATPFSDDATRLNQALLAIASADKANEWRAAARALRERAGADIGQATSQSAAGQALIGRGASRLVDVFEAGLTLRNGSTTFPANWTTFRATSASRFWRGCAASPHRKHRASLKADPRRYRRIPSIRSAETVERASWSRCFSLIRSASVAARRLQRTRCDRHEKGHHFQHS